MSVGFVGNSKPPDGIDNGCNIVVLDAKDSCVRIGNPCSVLMGLAVIDHSPLVYSSARGAFIERSSPSDWVD
jgi:hypothetical protein